MGLAACTSDSQAITAVSVQTGCLGCNTVLSRWFHLHGNSYISVATFLLTRSGFVLLFTTPGSEFSSSLSLWPRRRRQHSSPKRWYSPVRQWWQLINNRWNCKVFQLSRCLQISVKWRVCFDTPLDWTSSECVLLDNVMTTPEEFLHFYVCNVPSFLPLPFTDGTLAYSVDITCAHKFYTPWNEEQEAFIKPTIILCLLWRINPRRDSHVGVLRQWGAECAVSFTCNFSSVLDCVMGRGSSVGIATRYWLGGPGIEYRWRRDFSCLSRPSLGPTQPPIQ